MSKVYILLIFLIFISCSKQDIPFLNNTQIPEIEFVKTIGGSNNETIHAITSTKEGGYIVVGHTQSLDNDIQDKTDDSYKFWVLKFNSSNKLLWSKTYGGLDDDRARDIIELTDGSFIITGFSRSVDGDISNNKGNYDFWTIKIDETGNLIWEKTYGFSGSDQSYVIKKTEDGNFLLGGTLDVTASGGLGNSKTQHAGGDFWLIKIDENGNELWTRYFGGQFTDTLFDVAETVSGDFILIGSSDSEDTDISNNLGTYDFWVLKVSNDGNLIWEKNFGGSEIDEARGITATNDGNFIIVGDTRSTDKDVTNNNGGADLWLIKMSADGNLLWQKTYGGTSFDVGRSIKKTQDNGFLISGNSRSTDNGFTNQGQNDAWILKVDENGNKIWEKFIGGSQNEFLFDAIELNNKTIIAVGESSSSDVDISENKGFSDALIINIK